MSYRIADITDDYCPKCRRITDHAIAAVVGAPGAETIASVNCRTCSFQHEYRNAQVPVRRGGRKSSAFDQVLAGILGEPPPAETGGGRKKRRP